MKVLIGIKRTSQLSGIYEDAVRIDGQSTTIITSGTEEEVRSFVKKYRELEKQLPSLRDKHHEFAEYGWQGKSEEECEKIEVEFNELIDEASTLEKYNTVLMISGELL